MSYYRGHHENPSRRIEAGFFIGLGFLLFKLFLFGFVFIAVTMWLFLAKHPTIRNIITGFMFLLAVAYGLFVWALMTTR